MIWLALAALAMAALLGVLALVKGSGSVAGWEAVVAALLVGLAGYVYQGQPGLAGAPRVADEAPAGSAGAMDAQRRAMAETASGNNGAGSNAWLTIAEALTRHGEYAEAATVLRGAIDRDPHNGEAWLALGNALVGHAGGSLGPGALYAFRQAGAADPAAPGPPFFLGLAMARSGQLVAARGQWASLLARTPANAPWRAHLADELTRLDAMIAQARAEGAIP